MRIFLFRGLRRRNTRACQLVGAALASSVMLALVPGAGARQQLVSPACTRSELQSAIGSWKATLQDWRQTLRTDLASGHFESAASDGGSLADAARHAGLELSWYQACPPR